MLRLLLSLGLFLTNAQTIGTYTSSSSYSASASASTSASASIVPSVSSTPSASSLTSSSSIPPPSSSRSPLGSSVPPTNIEKTDTTMLGYIMVGCTLGALIIIGTIVGIHAVVKKRSENMKLVSRINTANTLNKINQASVRTLLPSQKILKYRDDSDNRMAFPPANHV